MSNDASDGRPGGPYEGSAMGDTQRFGHPGGPQLGPGYPTMPPPSPPSWLPSDTGRRPARKRGRGTLAAAAVALVVVAGGVGGGVGYAMSDQSSDTAPAASSAPATTLGAPPQNISAPSGTPKSYADIAAAVLPVVVSIDVLAGQSGDTGSGVVIRSDGYILTNNHVVAAASGVSGATITVHFNDGTSAPATIKGTDLSSDLAVIKVAKTGLDVAHLGTSAGVKVGDAVLAVGSPLGLSGTVTSGIVSALNRPVDTTADQQQEQQQQQQQNPFDPFGDSGGSGSGGSGSGGTGSATTSSTPTVFGAIQTDAAINPGNSGGALVDATGNVIGINSAIASLGSSGTSQSGSIGVGFAIPIDLAKNIANQLITTGKATHAQIGVSVEDDTNSSTGSTTVVVKAVTAGSPGDKAGIKAGDVITKVDATFATDSDTLIATIRSHLPGDTITVTYTRAGTSHTASVTLGSS
jgi:putative serine protease PepD